MNDDKQNGQDAPFLSVLVAVRNEAAFIKQTLEKLVAQDYRAERFEILVADGRSTDETRQIVAAFQERHPNVVLLDNPQRWASAGRNAGLRSGRGDVFVIIDGHCELDNTRYLSDLAEAFQRSGADCVGRPQPLDVAEASFLQRAIAAARTSRLGHHPDSTCYVDREGFVPPEAAAVAYRRSVFEKVGYFDETFDACEDLEFNYRVGRAGLRCFFTPRAQVRYVPRKTLGGLFRQMERYGRGRVRLLRKHPGTYTAATFLPAVFVAGLVITPALAAFIPVLGLLLGAAVSLYVSVVLFFSILLACRQREPKMAAALPFVFGAIHLGAGWGILHELIIGNRSGGPPALPSAQFGQPVSETLQQ